MRQPIGPRNNVYIYLIYDKRSIVLVLSAALNDQIHGFQLSCNRSILWIVHTQIPYTTYSRLFYIRDYLQGELPVLNQFLQLFTKQFEKDPEVKT